MILGNRFGAKLFAFLMLTGSVSWATEHSPQQNDGASSISEEQKEQAKRLYQEGVAAYHAGKFSEAVDKLLDADRVMPNAAFSYNIALVYQAMGDKRSALRWFRSYLRQSPAKDEKATEKVRALEAELQSRGLQQVTVLSKPAGATLRIDGNALGLTPFTTEIVPGSHTATITLDGYKAAQRSFELRPDRSIDVDVSLEPAQDSASPPPAPQATPVVPVVAPPHDEPPPPRASAPVPPPVFVDTHASRSIRPLTWAGLGVGTALLGGSVAFELMRSSAEKKARDASQADYASDYDTMKSRQTVARVLAVAGGVVFTTGVVLLSIDLSQPRGVKSASIRSCGNGGVCTSFEGHF